MDDLGLQFVRNSSEKEVRLESMLSILDDQRLVSSAHRSVLLEYLLVKESVPEKCKQPPTKSHQREQECTVPKQGHDKLSFSTPHRPEIVLLAL